MKRRVEILPLLNDWKSPLTNKWTFHIDLEYVIQSTDD